MTASAEAKAVVWSVVNDTVLRLTTIPRDQRAVETERILDTWLDAMREPERVLNLHDIGTISGYLEAPGSNAMQLLILTWMTGTPWSGEARIKTGYSLMGWMSLYPGARLPHQVKGILLVVDMLAHYPSKETERLLRHLTFLNGEKDK